MSTTYYLTKAGLVRCFVYTSDNLIKHYRWDNANIWELIEEIYEIELARKVWRGLIARGWNRTENVLSVANVGPIPAQQKPHYIPPPTLINSDKYISNILSEYMVSEIDKNILDNISLSRSFTGHFIRDTTT